MTGIKCSVVVPISQARNKRDTLGYWLGSPEAKHFEIILVHDLADGQTNEKYESYIQEFSASTIILLSGNFGNPGEARNLGLSYASAKWVVFWDSDDLPDLKCQMIALEKADAEQAEVVISDFRTVSDSPVQSEKIFRLDAQTNLTYELIARPGIWRFTFRRSVLNNKFFIKSRMAEDQVFIAKCEIYNLKILISNQITYSYFTGNNAHLVEYKPALKDLLLSIKSLKEASRNQTGSNLFLTNGFIVKNLITILKKCRLHEKISSLWSILVLLIKHPIILLKSTLILFKEKRS